MLLSSNYRVIKKYEAVRVPHRALGTADSGDPSNITLFRGTWNLTGAIRLTERQQMMRDKDQVIKKPVITGCRGSMVLVVRIKFLNGSF